MHSWNGELEKRALAAGRHCDLLSLSVLTIPTNPETATQLLTRPDGSVMALNNDPNYVRHNLGKVSQGRLYSVPCSISRGSSKVGRSIWSQDGWQVNGDYPFWFLSIWLLYLAYVSSLWWLSSKDECPKRGGNCTGFYNAASEVLELCFGQIVLVIIVKQIYPDSKEGGGTQTSIGQWQGSEWAYEMGNIITGISGKFHLLCFPFDPNGILQLIKFLNFNEVQCINLPPYLILCVC